MPFVLLFLVFYINCAQGYNNLETLKSLEIQNTEKLMEFIAQTPNQLDGQK
jgi:hypothetical protein